MVNARRVWLLWAWCVATIALSGARVAAWQGDLFPPELVSFAPEPVEPVFQGAGAGQWDQHIRERGWILREGDLYRMWYTGYDDVHRVMKLGYATSPDGVHWTRHAKNPIYDAHWVEDMMVVRQGDTYYMFAEGEQDRAQLLTSPDGITWTRVGQLDVRKKNGQPIDPGPYGTPTAWWEDGVWYLFYERRDLGIWLATSRDLKVWTNVQDEPVIPLGPEEYDREQVALNQIVKHRGRYYAYYHGAGPVRGGRRLWCTCVATSSDLVHWEKYPRNPLFPVEENKSSGILVHDGQRYLLYTMHPHVQRHVPQQPVPPPAARSQSATVLGIRGTQFTLNGRPTFLLGLSYYGGLGAAEATIRRDLEDAQKHGFNWIRVWATWAAFGQDVSAVDEQGRPRAPYLEKLQWLVAECDRRGIVVDVTLSRGNGVTGPARLQSLEAHRRAVQTLVTALTEHRNWYLDLANERSIRDRRYVSFEELRSLQQTARALAPELLVTASHAGGDLTKEDVRGYLEVAGVDFLSPHRPRRASSPAQTEEVTRQLLAWCRELGREVPIHYQEPFRRGFGNWEPTADDFLTDLRGARAGGAAGWCFHNGDTRNAPDGQPRRSFDLREARLFEQLDAEEQRVLTRLLQTLATIDQAGQRPAVRPNALAPIAAVASAAAPAAGPLRVHPDNPRYFTDGTRNPDGTLRAVYLTGSHTWNNLVDMPRDAQSPPLDYAAYLDFLQRHGHNFIRLWAWDSTTWDTRANGRHAERPGVHRVTPHPWRRTGPGEALDGLPKFDLTQFDPAYFQRLRQRVEEAGRRGIYVSVMLFEGWGLFHGNRGRAAPEGWAWRSHPFHPSNNINNLTIPTDASGLTGKVHVLGNEAVNALQAAYIRQVVDAVGDLDNVLYEVINEGGEKEWDWWVVRTIQEYERTRPKQHPVGLTGHGAERVASMLASPADWVSPGRNDGYGEDPPAWNEKKPSLLDTDHIWGVGGNVDWAWKSFVRGHNPLFMDPYQHELLGRGDPQQWEPLRQALGQTRRLAQRLSLAAMTPRNELASTGYCLAEVGRAYVVYAPQGGQVTVDLQGAQGLFAVEWIDPVQGTSTAGAAIRGGEQAMLTGPREGAVVLYLRQAQ
jgi:hypothetical protein